MGDQDIQQVPPKPVGPPSGGEPGHRSPSHERSDAGGEKRASRPQRAWASTRGLPGWKRGAFLVLMIMLLSIAGCSAPGAVELEEATARADSEAKRADRQSERVAELEEELAELEGQLSDLSGQLADAERAAESVGEAEERIAELEAELADAQASVEEAEAHAAELAEREGALDRREDELAEREAAVAATADSPPVDASESEAAEAPASADGCEPGQVDINTAGFEELQRIHEIGPDRAQQIIDLRPFGSVDDLTRVSGIAEGRLGGIKAQGLACAS